MPSGDSTGPVLDVLVGVLRSNLGDAVGDRVFRDLPGPEATYPLVCVGEVLRSAWDDDDCPGSDLQIELRAYARGVDARETVDALAAGINMTLNHAVLAVPGHDVAGCFILDARTTRDEVQATALVRVRVLTSAS